VRLGLEAVEQGGEKERLGEARVAPAAGSPRGEAPALPAFRGVYRAADRRVALRVRVEQES
jgi:hypothetical protein